MQAGAKTLGLRAAFSASGLGQCNGGGHQVSGRVAEIGYIITSHARRLPFIKVVYNRYCSSIMFILRWNPLEGSFLRT